ncbi:MAG: hypothetical protein FJX74_23080 [Armatimonadetes bacterium]|nr:hypothetical protein [Armatimonadota bacterium]
MLNLNGGYYAEDDPSFDEVRIYSRPLPPEAIAALARGETPDSAPSPPAPLDVREQYRREQYSWTTADLAALPAAGAAAGVHLDAH